MVKKETMKLRFLFKECDQQVIKLIYTLRRNSREEERKERKKNEGEI